MFNYKNYTEGLLAEFLNRCQTDFEGLALELFDLHYTNNPVYRTYIDALGINCVAIDSWHKIPCLPIRFFKSREVILKDLRPQLIFGSSGTTGSVRSRHYVAHPDWYRAVSVAIFEQFFGKIADWYFLSLLPNYLDRPDSSLIYMLRVFMEEAKQPLKFYKTDYQAFLSDYKSALDSGKKIMVWGVPYALLNLFAENEIGKNESTFWMETGGMKGMRQELFTDELHEIISAHTGSKNIYTEYGMTEMLSQAYGKAGNIHSGPTLRVFFREIEDPFGPPTHRGRLNVIDLANVYSCPFIETEDLGIKHCDGSFAIMGRLTQSDLRGCNLLFA